MRPACPLLGIAILAVAAAAQAQPTKAPTPADLDRLAVDVLKDVHNRGAELYNRGDPAGSYRMYEGALLTVRPFLAHRPAAQKLIDDGLTEVAGKAADGPKVQAFRLHEVIEQVRAELRKADAKSPEPAPKPAESAGAGLRGVITLDGQPLADGDVTLVSLNLPRPRVFTAKVKDGAYTFGESVPPGKYVVLVGKGPARYQDAGTSPLRIDVADGAGPVNLDLTAK